MIRSLHEHQRLEYRTSRRVGIAGDSDVVPRLALLGIPMMAVAIVHNPVVRSEHQITPNVSENAARHNRRKPSSPNSHI